MTGMVGKIWSSVWAKVAIVVVAVFLLLIFVLPLFVNANTFRPVLENQLSQVLGRKVTLGNLKFSLLAGALQAKDISIADDAAFSTQPFLRAQSIDIKVETWPLVFRHELIVNGLTISSPSIRLISNDAGVWNFSSIGKAAASKPAEGESSIPNLTIDRFDLVGGSAEIATLGSPKPPMKIQKIDLHVRQFSFLKSFPFELKAVMGQSGTLSMTGTAGPINRQDASNTPFSVKAQFKNFDPVAIGLLGPNEGLSMTADITAQAQSDGATLTSSGNVRADHLRLVNTGKPAPVPVQVTYSVHHDLAARKGTIDQLDVKTAAEIARCSGTYQLTAQSATVALNVAVPHVPVDQVEALLPAAGVALPTGSKLQGGTITANLTASGPLSGLTIRGPVEIDNTRLAGFDLGSQIEGLKAVHGNGGTAIHVLKAAIDSSPATTRISSLYLDVPALGTASGAGTVSPAGALNFQLVAKLNPTSGTVSQALAGLENSHGTLGQILGTAKDKGVPLTITGTTADPKIQADVSGLIRNNAGSLLGQQLKKRLGNQNGKSPANDILNRILGH